jgi:hypothetical protein
MRRMKSIKKVKIERRRITPMERTMVATSDPCVSLASPTPSTFLVS